MSLRYLPEEKERACLYIIKSNQIMSPLYHQIMSPFWSKTSKLFKMGFRIKLKYFFCLLPSSSSPTCSHYITVTLTFFLTSNPPCLFSSCSIFPWAIPSPWNALPSPLPNGPMTSSFSSVRAQSKCRFLREFFSDIIYSNQSTSYFLPPSQPFFPILWGLFFFFYFIFSLYCLSSFSKMKALQD